jgi:hypothetical protein
LGLGSHFVSGSAGSVRGATWGRKESPALRGEHRGIGSVLKWQSMPSVVSCDPVKDRERVHKAHLILLGGPHEARPSIKDVN